MSKQSPSPARSAAETIIEASPAAYTVIETVKGERQPIECPDYVNDAAINLSENSIKVLEKRYLRRDFDGSYLETPAGMFYRVAYHIAQVEREHDGDVDGATRVFYDLLSERRFFPNSPTFTGAGTPLGQLAACFVLPIEDDMGKEADGIFSTLRVAALIQQTGGGNGFSFSRLRPKNDIVHTSSGRATGPVGFLRVYDQAFGEIAQGGSRRGANMGVLRVDHPDIEEFVGCKAEEGKIANFNISVAITDEFMAAVRDDTDFDLRNPRNGGVWKTLRARDLFAKIIRYAHHNGEPGALFIDAANRSNPVPHLYDLEATNPCFVGETRIPTEFGLLKIAELADLEQGGFIVTDNRALPDEQPGIMGGVALRMASPAWMTRQQTPVMRLTTRQGYTVTATPDHRFLTPRGYVALRDLATGDRLLLQSGEGAWSRDDRLPQVELLHERMAAMAHGGSHATGRTSQRSDFQAQYANLPTTWSHSLGVVLGCLVGDGWLSEESNSPVGFAFSEAELLDQVHGPLKNWFGEGHVHQRNLVSQLTYGRLPFHFFQSLGVSTAKAHEKCVPASLWRAPRAAVVGFLQGLFSADGTVLVNEKKQDCSVRLASSSQRLLQEVQLLLGNFGIVARIQLRRLAGVRPLPDGKGGSRLYAHQAQYELILGKANRDLFAEKIGFLQSDKQAALMNFIAGKKRTTNRERYEDTVRSIEDAGVADVYDLTQPDTHSLIANGLVAHNCGEQWLGPYENCCLGSINLAKHVALDADDEPVVDWALLERTVRESTSFLDNVVSANAYVPAVPEVAEAAYRARRIGLGIMGLGDMMYKLGIRYGSENGQEFAAQIMEFVRFHSMQRSVELAEARGPFLAFAGSIYDKDAEGGMKWQTPVPLRPFSHDWQRPALDWAGIVRGIEAHGIRNAAQTTVAPTGTIATVVGCEGYGCEPVFALGYVRHFKDGDKDVELVYTSPLFDQALERTKLDDQAKAHIKQHVATYGSCQGLEELPDDLRNTFVVSGDITADEHVLMQAAIQAFTDNSISKCVTGDTLVLTENGLVAIEELSDQRLPDQFAPLKQRIVSPQGVESTDAFYYGGYRETRKVAFDYGFEIEGTGNHRIQVLDEQGSVQFRRLDELRPGDVAIFYGNQQRFGAARQALPAYSGSYRTNSKRVTFPVQMSEELAFFLGCVTSEGAITRNGVAITNTDTALLESLQASVRRLFGLESLVLKDNRNTVHSLQINSRPLRNWLLVDLEMEAGAENKVIPACILRGGQAEVASFLRGLMLDGFMNANGRMLGITLASRRLIQQLQTLLLNMGVLATVRRTAERAWSLTVQGGELETLAEQISFVEVWKNERLAQRNTGRVMRLRNYSRLLPAAVTTALRELQVEEERSLRSFYSDAAEDQAAYQRVRVNLLQGHRLERGDAQHLFQTLEPVAPNTYAASFFAQDEPGKVYVEVASVATGFAEVFDISVPGSHTFVANGLGNHNTCNFPEGATEEDVAKAYMLAWETGCKGLTVYVTGSREQVVLETKATKQKKEEPNGKAADAAQNNGHYANGHHGEGDAGHGVIDFKHSMVKRPRPAKLHGATYRKDTPLGTAYITVNSDDRNEPFEVFMNVGKAGTEVTAVSEAMGRLISLVLRMPASLPPAERLRWVMDEMAGIGGGRPLGFGANRVRSLPDGIAQVLAEHLSELPMVAEEPQAEQLALPIAAKPIGDICPECGEASFLNVEGCRKCAVCGYSEC